MTWLLSGWIHLDAIFKAFSRIFKAVSRHFGVHGIVDGCRSGPLEDTVSMEIRRPRAIKVSLSKPGALGLKLDYQDHSAGAVRLGLIIGIYSYSL